jgi:hypothetical protein
VKQIKVKASKRDLDKKISQYIFDNKNFVCRNAEDDYHVVNEQNGLVAYIQVPHYSTNLSTAWDIAFRWWVGIKEETLEQCTG